MNIAADLGAESFGIGPAHLGTEPFEEGKGEGRLFVEVDWVEVEQVGFDSEGVCAEGGAVADVGDGFKGFGGFTGADG